MPYKVASDVEPRLARLLVARFSKVLANLLGLESLSDFVSDVLVQFKDHWEMNTTTILTTEKIHKLRNQIIARARGLH